MTHIDAAVLTPGTGFIFTAAPGTARPLAAAIAAYTPMNDTAFAGYTSIGHTSRDDLPVFGFDGGDTSVLGTWSNASFREVVTEAPADFVTFNALQFDEQVLSFYYGVTDATPFDGTIDVANSPTTTTNRALLVIIIDGPRRVAFHASSVSLRREDSIQMSTDAFAAFPLRATFLKLSTNPIYSWVGVSNALAS